jgi:hypothetical protein
METQTKMCEDGYAYKLKKNGTYICIEKNCGSTRGKNFNMNSGHSATCRKKKNEKEQPLDNYQKNKSKKHLKIQMNEKEKMLEELKIISLNKDKEADYRYQIQRIEFECSRLNDQLMLKKQVIENLELKLQYKEKENEQLTERIENLKINSDNQVQCLTKNNKMLEEENELLKRELSIMKKHLNIDKSCIILDNKSLSKIQSSHFISDISLISKNMTIDDCSVELRCAQNLSFTNIENKSLGNEKININEHPNPYVPLNNKDDLYDQDKNDVEMTNDCISDKENRTLTNEEHKIISKDINVKKERNLHQFKSSIEADKNILNNNTTNDLSGSNNYGFGRNGGDILLSDDTINHAVKYLKEEHEKRKIKKDQEYNRIVEPINLPIFSYQKKLGTFGIMKCDYENFIDKHLINVLSLEFLPIEKQFKLSFEIIAKMTKCHDDYIANMCGFIYDKSINNDKNFKKNSLAHQKMLVMIHGIIHYIVNKTY